MVKSEDACDPHLSLKRANRGKAVCEWDKWGGLERCCAEEIPSRFYRCANCNLWICYQCNAEYVKTQLAPEEWEDGDFTIVATSSSGAGGDPSSPPLSGRIDSASTSISTVSVKLEAGSIKVETIPAGNIKKERKKKKKPPKTRKKMAVYVDDHFWYITTGAKVKVDGVNVTFQNKCAGVAVFKMSDGSTMERCATKTVTFPETEFSISLQIEFRADLPVGTRQLVYKKTKQILKEYPEIFNQDVALLPDAVAIEASFFSEASLRAFDDATSDTFLEKIRLSSSVPHGCLRATAPDVIITKNDLIVKAKSFRCWDIHCPDKFHCLSRSTILNHLCTGSTCFEKLKSLGSSYQNTVRVMESLLSRDFNSERNQTDIIRAANILQACVKIDYRKNELEQRLLAAIHDSKTSPKLDIEFSLGRSQFVAWVVTKGDLWGYLPASDSFLLQFKTRAHLSEYINEYYLTGESIYTKEQRWVEVDDKHFEVRWKQFGCDFMHGTVRIKGLLNVVI